MPGPILGYYVALNDDELHVHVTDCKEQNSYMHDKRYTVARNSSILRINNRTKCTDVLPHDGSVVYVVVYLS